MEELKEIVVICHAQCRDGFGAAYAAWKKFSDTASYIPLRNQTDLPFELKDKIIYVLDYSFSEEKYLELRANNESIIVIDHHQSAKEVVSKYSENIFDQGHSGAVLSWMHFHPATPVPSLLLYVEDHDLWQFKLPHNREFNSAMKDHSTTFTAWDELIVKLEDETFFNNFIKTGAIISKFEDKLVDDLLQYRERAIFEGHEIWVLNVSRTYRSILCHKLATLNKEAGGVPFAVVYYRNLGAVHLSLRSEDDFDVAEIALKYGGGGHKHSASIRVESFADLPFKFL